MLRKIYFYSSVASVYLLTIGALGATLSISHIFRDQAWSSKDDQATKIYRNEVKQTTKTLRKTVSGQPTHILIPSRNIDLPISEGKYDSLTKTWTLSPTHATFAVTTMPANNLGGMTFIYGHGTDAVFGKIGSDYPANGSAAIIHTDNNHVFTYVLRSIRRLQPNDTSILRNITKGPPRLIVQTCTGIFSEWRTEFIYTLKKVE